jgi:Holliday junction DNA helicase RuvB
LNGSVRGGYGLGWSGIYGARNKGGETMLEIISLAIAICAIDYIRKLFSPKPAIEPVIVPANSKILQGFLIENPGPTGWENIDTSKFVLRKRKSDPLVMEIREPQIDIDNINSSNEPVKKFIYRPNCFEDYIGQPTAKARCQLVISKIQAGMKTHILIDGIRGHGKTTLVRIVANQLGAHMIERVGKMVTVDNLVEILNEINGSTAEHVMFFVDEMDKLSSDVLKILNPVLEDFEIAGKHVRKFIFAGATINKFDLINRAPDTLDRIDTHIRLERYSMEDVAKILVQYKIQLYNHINVTGADVVKLAMNCKFNPRTGISMLSDLIILKTADEVLKVNNVLKDGLTTWDKRILETLAGSTKAMGANALAQRVGLSQADYQTEYEPYLAEMGYIARVPSRIITEKGKKILEVL